MMGLRLRPVPSAVEKQEQWPEDLGNAHNHDLFNHLHSHLETLWGKKMTRTDLSGAFMAGLYQRSEK